MRYGLYLLPDAFLLFALLRMTFVHLHTERRAMFCFLAAWLTYSIVTLFLAQVWPTDSIEYVRVFGWLSVAVWICGGPALIAAGQRVSQSYGYSAYAIGVLVTGYFGIRIALANSAFSSTGKILAVNCWCAAVAGSLFLFASIGAESPDKILWRCVGAFFFIFGYGYLFIGIMRSPAWAYAALIICSAVAWLALAWLAGPRHDHLFNLEKLAFIPSIRLQLAIQTKSSVLAGQGEGNG